MKTILILVVLALAGCLTEEHEAANTLRAFGFSEYRFTGASYFECGKDDKVGLGFTAKNPLGERVEGTVCCGLWKACTVRF